MGFIQLGTPLGARMAQRPEPAVGTKSYSNVVLLDGSAYLTTSFGGITRYISGLAQGLREAGKDVEILLPGPAKNGGPHVPNCPIVTVPTTTPGWWFTEQPARLDAVAARRRGLVVHDMMSLDPTLNPPSESRFPGDPAAFSRACRHADVVITVSACTRDALFDAFPGVPAD